MNFLFLAIVFTIIYLLYKFFTSDSKNKKETSAGIAGGVTGALIGKSIGIAALGGAIAGTVPIALASAAMTVLAVKAFSNKKQEIYKLDNGNEYCGPLKDDSPHGYGVLVLENGDQYIGEFKEGFFHGLGTYTWKNGDQYTGQFENDERNGMGTFITNEGTKFEGKFINNRFYNSENSVKKYNNNEDFAKENKSYSLFFPWIFVAGLFVLLIFIISKK